MAMSAWWKAQKIKKAREALVGVAHTDNGTSVLKISLSGKVKDNSQTKTKTQAIKGCGRNVKNQNSHTGKGRKYCD